MNNKYSEKYGNPYDSVPNELIDAMDDTDYQVFIEAYKAWHRRHWPSSCMRLPNRKTKKQREIEAQEHKDFLKQFPEIADTYRAQDIRTFEKEYPEYKIVKRE